MLTSKYKQALVAGAEQDGVGTERGGACERGRDGKDTGQA